MQLDQKPLVLWLTGLSGAGKSTLAEALQQKLEREAFFTKWLDGDNLRNGLNQGLGFSEADRTENIRRAAEVAKLFCESGIITICTFVSPGREMRKLAETIIGTENFREVFVNCPVEVCAQRDVKGLYKQAKTGQLGNLTGVGAPYEPPQKPWLELRTAEMNLEACLEKLYKALLPHLK